MNAAHFLYGSSGGLFEGGGLFTICSSRVGAYLRGGGFLRGANSRIYGISGMSFTWIPSWGPGILSYHSLPYECAHPFCRCL